VQGSYCFELQNVTTNVLDTGGVINGVWFVRRATLDPASVSSFCITVVPPCDPDYTGDGNVDQEDIDCLVDLISGDPSCSPNDPDFNQDGHADQTDVANLIAVVAGGPCS
jgi:hypothetical protein